MFMQFTRGIRFEVAQDVLGALLAHWSEAAAQALDAANLGLGRLAEMRDRVARKLRSLHHFTKFLYNGLEQRVAKSGPLGTFFYVYDEAGHILGEYDSAGAPLYEVVWLGDMPIGTIRTPAIPLTTTGTAYVDDIYVDHLNTPRTIVSGGNTYPWYWWLYDDGYAQYTPPLTQAGYAFNLRMPGQIFDKETGLFHNGHRDYNPATGRYIQPDPIGLAGGINRYAYVGGNPVMWSDPEGLAATNWSNTSGGRSPVSDGPTNGNWGGGKWSGGVGGGGTGTAPALDSGDECYKRHDQCYDAGTKKATCDRELVKELKALPTDPRKWSRPPSPGTEGDSDRYRRAAIILFDK